MSEYNVHIFAEYRVVIEGVEADSMELACRKATEGHNFNQHDQGDNFAFAEQIYAYLVDVVGDEEFDKSTAFDYQQVYPESTVPSTEGLIPVDIFNIQAECHSDDQVVKVSFYADPWFRQSPDQDIFELAKCGWGGDYPADRVALWMAGQNTEIHGDVIFSGGLHVDGKVKFSGSPRRQVK